MPSSSSKLTGAIKMTKRLLPTISKRVTKGLALILQAIDLSVVAENDDARAAYLYLKSLNDALHSDEYKARQNKNNEWIRKAREAGYYDGKGKINI